MRFKRLENYRTGYVGNDMRLEIPLPTTPDGRVYRYSPNQDAHPRHFLLGNRVEGFETPKDLTSRMLHMPGTPGTICPYSGILGEDDAFTHPDDITAAQEIVTHAAEADIADAFHGMFKDLARKNSTSKFVRVEAGSKPHAKPRPRFARRDLLRELVCDECGRDYGVFAISLFCPDCGTPNIHLHFAREVEIVGEQVKIAGKLAVDQGELAYRLLGNAHEDVLTAFEATLKTVYLYKLTTQLSDESKAKSVGNAFQNVERGQKLFAKFDFDPYGSLSDDALAVLTLNIQKQHVIGHNLGIADGVFAKHAAEARIGETVPLVGEDILQFADICKMTVNNIDAWLANGTPPPDQQALLVKPIVAPQEKRPTGLKIGELGQLAVRIGLWVSEQSDKGLDDFITEDDLTTAFLESTIDELAFAVAELAADGYFRTTPLVSKRIPRIRVATELFIVFDPHTMQANPALDVVEIVDIALTKDRMVGAEELHEASGWSLRRFNPAFAYMISRIDERHVLSEGTNDYPARGFLLTDEGRVALKRFVNRLRP